MAVQERSVYHPPAAQEENNNEEIFLSFMFIASKKFIAVPHN
jgi:hypothetical protein